MPTIEELERRLAESERAREQAEAVSRAKDEFLATLSHELRTPLTSIVGWAHLLRAGQLDPATAARAVETIDRNAQMQTQLISDILDVSRVASGKMRLNVRPTDLRTVLEAALEAARPAADARGVRLQPEIDPQAGSVSGDPDRLQQVVWNLLDNAIKFTPRGGAVTLRLARQAQQVELAVEDSGIGIRPERLPHVFDRFHHGDGTVRERGLGLGLAIVRHLVELHRGSVEASSPGAGQGATFRVLLPAGVASAVSAADPREAPEMSLDGVHVLVVEDQDDARDLVQTVLSQRGARVTAVASAAEALAAFEHAVPDVMLSDIEMADEDGYSLMRKVRQRSAERGGRIPAAALTAYARTEDRMQALLAGYQIHVPKPVHPDELATVVASLAGRPT